jgi:hypothetical protein
MSRWFRHYAGMARDDKLVSVAIKSRQSIERVVWIWAAILESAAEIDDEGRYRLDAAEVAYFLRADEADILAVEAALAGASRVDAGRVVKWGNRQFRSDRSADRVAAHRERKRQEVDRDPHHAASQNGAVTLQERHCNSPETELELEQDTTTVAIAPVVERAKRKTRIAPNWQPSESGLASAAKRDLHGNAMEQEVSRFVSHHTAKGNLMASWDAAWITWLDSPYRQSARASPSHRQAKRNTALDGLDELERRFSNVQQPSFLRIAG